MDPIVIGRWEQAYGVIYSETKQRALSAGLLLPGTPGFLKEKLQHGSIQIYRVHQDGAGRRVEQYVGPQSNEELIGAMRDRIAEAQWIQAETARLRTLGFQVADKAVGEVLVAFHNRRLFEAGLVLVGTLAVMSWINELGVAVGTAMTKDVDFARHHHIALAAPDSFAQIVKSTNLDFTPVPGMPSHAPSTSMKRKGREGLKIDMLAPGPVLGQQVRIPELDWVADTVPFYDWMLSSTEMTGALAGRQCVPVRVPQAARLAWHKFYSSTQRHSFQDKAAKDRYQAAVLTATLSDVNPSSLVETYRSMPAVMRSHVDEALRLTHFGASADLVEEMLVAARDDRDREGGAGPAP